VKLTPPLTISKTEFMLRVRAAFHIPASACLKIKAWIASPGGPVEVPSETMRGDAQYAVVPANPLEVWSQTEHEYRQNPEEHPGRRIEVKVKCGSRKVVKPVNTCWGECWFKQLMAKHFDIPENFTVRVEMKNAEGRRQHEFRLREDWKYEITSSAPEDGTEEWRTKPVFVETPRGTAQLLVHPECTQEELTRDIKHAMELPPDAPGTAERTDGADDGEVTEGK
jgi:hypothetical protein